MKINEKLKASDLGTSAKFRLYVKSIGLKSVQMILKPISKMWIRVPRLKAGFHVLHLINKCVHQGKASRELITESATHSGG
jgi:hypothetical protein